MVEEFSSLAWVAPGAFWMCLLHTLQANFECKDILCWLT